MAEVYKIILTSEDYFDIIDFDEQPPKEQIAYILFYVTKVAKLRKDMIPEIIADRIQDQYRLLLKRSYLKDGEELRQLTRDKVTEIMQNTPDYFEESIYGVVDKSDRKKRDVAYVLTKKKFNELESEFTKEIKDKIRKVNLAKKWEVIYISLTIVLIAVLIYFGIYGWLGLKLGIDDGHWVVFIDASFKGFISLIGPAIAIWGAGFGVGKRLLFKNKG